MGPIFKRIIYFLLLFFVAPAFILYFKFVPREYNGSVFVNGIQESVELKRTQEGILSVSASNDNDAFFGLGYAHAQDRLWQLFVQKRMASGNLSEVFGERMLQTDAYMRTLNLKSLALNDINLISKEARLSLQAYASGINAFIKSSQTLPPEFAIFNVKPDLWEPSDSLAWSKIFALNLSDNLWDEIERFIITRNLPFYLAKDLYGDIDLNANSVVKHSDLNFIETFDIFNQIKKDFGIGSKYAGSNAWVVSPTLTETGSAILANDPHLSIQIPSPWYAASLYGEKIKSTGMTLVGLPVVIFGRNENISWAGAALTADVQDLYIEKANGQYSNSYYYDSDTKMFEVSEQEIKVAAEFPSFIREPVKPKSLIIKKSIRGPIINDALGIEGQPISLQWTGLELGDRSYETFFELNYAKDWFSFRKALEDHRVPALSFLYADIEGNIGFQAAGAIPIRKEGMGLYPSDGSRSLFGWDGYIPFDELPRQYNPEKGYIIAANQDITAKEYPYHISSSWAPFNRADRIEEILTSRAITSEKVNVELTKNIQSDIHNYNAVKLRSFFKQIDARSDFEVTVKNRLLDWDSKMDAESSGATIYSSFIKNLKIIIFKDEFASGFLRKGEQDILNDAYMSIPITKILDILSYNSEDWCDNGNTLEKESCSWAINQAFNNTVKELKKLNGSKIKNWNWGETLKAHYEHFPLSAVKSVAPLFERRVMSIGGDQTVNVGPSTFQKSDGYVQKFGASFRQIISFEVGGNTHLYMNSTGQSGNFLSPNYDNLLNLFSKNKYLDFSQNVYSSSHTLLPQRKEEEDSSITIYE